MFPESNIQLYIFPHYFPLVYWFSHAYNYSILFVTDAFATTKELAQTQRLTEVFLVVMFKCRILFYSVVSYPIPSNQRREYLITLTVK